MVKVYFHKFTIFMILKTSIFKIVTIFVIFAIKKYKTLLHVTDAYFWIDF